MSTINEEREKELLRLEIEDFRFVMNRPEGRRFIRRLFGKTGFMRHSQSTNAGIYVESGKRAIGAALIEMAGMAGYTSDHFIQVITCNNGSDMDQPYLEVRTNG